VLLVVLTWRFQTQVQFEFLVGVAPALPHTLQIIFLLFDFGFLSGVLLRVLPLGFHAECLLDLALPRTLEIIGLAIHSLLHFVRRGQSNCRHILLALATGVFIRRVLRRIFCLGRLYVKKGEVWAHLRGQVQCCGGFVGCRVLVCQFGVV